MDTKVLIIGAGHAGIETAASLRNLGFSGKIEIFDQENTLPYQKPPLSKSYIKSFDTKEALLRSKEWYDNNKIDLKLNTNIKFINDNHKSLSDEYNNFYHYDKLVIATGSKNNLLGIDTKEYQKGNLFSLRNLEDSKSIRKKISVVNEVIKELELKNINSQWSRAEDLDYSYDFLVTRAVAKLPTLIDWSKGRFNKYSSHEIENGIIALKGGDIDDELNGISEKRVLDIKNIFDIQYFCDKKIVYIPSSSI